LLAIYLIKLKAQPNLENRNAHKRLEFEAPLSASSMANNLFIQGKYFP
jgi:hypothetical protein